MPVTGPETIDLLQQAPAGSQEMLRQSAVSILARGGDPGGEPEQYTGLVVGYVQSGKTLSFETVAALARDNSFQVVIVIAGTSTALLDQSTRRLQRDLSLDDPDRPRRWIQFTNPSPDDLSSIRNTIQDWRDPVTPPAFKKTILITVLKHHLRLRQLTRLFGRLDMTSCPVLIIDDEADQASLNIEAGQGTESTTYRRLMALRRVLPHHTYLQYTATPQAPLLVSIADSLSPDFVEILDPGADYIGAEAFFERNLRQVRIIPSSEVPNPMNPLVGPPATLLEALRVFMIGVVDGILSGVNSGNRSMLVHPSRLVAQHRDFYDWVSNVVRNWQNILQLPDSDPDKDGLINHFCTAYADLADTVGDTLRPFDELVRYLPLGFRNTQVLEVNAREGSTPGVPWNSNYGWILVGGQAMDRGFTVEGLTVTYMPRGVGVGNADTVQQRARFLGYKRSYLGYCRLYLESGTADAFDSYVQHEEIMRRELRAVRDAGTPLDQWKRAFVLDPGLRPCRRQVMEFGYLRGEFSDDWAIPRIVFQADEVMDANRNTVAEFLNKRTFVPAGGHEDRTEMQRHDVCHDVPLADVLEELLVPMRITAPLDSERNTGMLLQLSRIVDESHGEVCTVYRMSGASRRTRGVNDNGEITNLFQGAYPVMPVSDRGRIYPGDRWVRVDDGITIQVHTLDLEHDGEVVARHVPVVAVWIPRRLAVSWIVQQAPPA